MTRLLGVVTFGLLALVLAFGISGCTSHTAESKAPADKMSGEAGKMSGDKMATDKMSGDKMTTTDKMPADKM